MATNHTHVVSTNSVVGVNSPSHGHGNFTTTGGGNPWHWQSAPYNPNMYPNSYPGVTTFPPSSNPYTTVQSITQPVEGSIGIIGGVPHRFEKGIWVQIEPSDETVGAPEIRIVLDASAMLNALRSYRDFLDSIEGLDKETHNIVDDTLFGLREAIEALEKIGSQ